MVVDVLEVLYTGNVPITSWLKDGHGTAAKRSVSWGLGVGLKVYPSSFSLVSLNNLDPALVGLGN